VYETIVKGIVKLTSNAKATQANFRYQWESRLAPQQSREAHKASESDTKPSSAMEEIFEFVFFEAMALLISAAA